MAEGDNGAVVQRILGEMEGVLNQSGWQEKDSSCFLVSHRKSPALQRSPCTQHSKSSRLIHDNLRAEHNAFFASLRACAKQKHLHRCTRLHADLLKRGVFEKSSYVADALVCMYAKCGALVKAQVLLNWLPVQDVFSWTALISRYAQQGQGQEAPNYFGKMQCKGISPDAVTFICTLNACGSIKAEAKGRQIHDEIVEKGFLENNVMLGTALVDMYAKCGALEKAQKVLEELPGRDVIPWNALIGGYAQQR